MIVTCASCLTKFNLDETKIPAKGAKVRCSRCQHVFYVTAPPETKEEILEDFESFAKYHKTVMGPGQKGEEVTEKEVEEEAEEPSPPSKKKGKEPLPVSFEEKEEAEEEFLFSEKTPKKEEAEEAFPEEELARAKAFRPATVARKERRGLPLFLLIVVLLLLVVFGLFYLWTEVRSGGRLPSLLDYPVKKIVGLWEQISGAEKALSISDLNGYEERVGESLLFIIEGKVTNQSRAAKKHIRIRVDILNQQGSIVAEKEAICGRAIAREELKDLLPTLLKGDGVVKPEKQKDRMVPSGKAVPFMVIFKDLPGEAKEFKVEIVEAPDL